MSETARLGGKRLLRLVSLVTVVALGFVLGAVTLLFWPHRPPSSRYKARLVAMQWVQEPKSSGSLLALCVRVTRQDGKRLVSGDFNVSIYGAVGQGLQPSTAVAKYLPNLGTARTTELIFFYRGIGSQPLLSSLDGELSERMPPDAFQDLMRRLGHPMETFFVGPVEGMPTPIPPTSPRTGQIDLTAFIVGAKRQPR